MKSPTSEASRYTYGITIRPTSKENIQRIKEEPERLGIKYMQVCLQYNLRSEKDWVIEKFNHLHGLVSAVNLCYSQIKQDNPGWHIYLRKKRGVELKVWTSYLEKDIIPQYGFDYLKHEYGFRDE